jgi:hypothetical protein
VWNYLEATCIQTFSGPSLQHLGRFPISGFYYNAPRKQLAVASQLMAIFSRRVNPDEMAEVSAHDFPISCVAYSTYFDEVRDYVTRNVLFYET